MQTELDLIRAEMQRIERKGVLGRSRSYSKLLAFLVHCRAQQRAPKEVEIAIEVFGKDADFDPTLDSMVRVYTHNLRQKLERYYAKGGAAESRQLVLARGEYRILLRGEPAPAPAPEPIPPGHQASTAPAPALPSGAARDLPAARSSARGPDASGSSPVRRHGAALVAMLVLGTAVGFGLRETHRSARVSPPGVVAAAPLWASLFDDSTPVLVVVGDYYIFAELDEQGGVERLVRHFDVNSSKDLDELMMYAPDLLDRYMDLDLTYLPRGAAVALLDALRVLYARDKPVRVTSTSDLNAEDLKSNHIVYIGYISGLGMLEDFVFASSGLSVGDSYDELRNVAGGQLYAGEAGISGAQRNYRDYGLLSAFPGPNGNQFLIIAGMRDPGMMHTAHVLAEPAALRKIENARPDAQTAQRPAFEMLYEVTGSERTNFEAMLVHTARLDAQQIWGGHFLHAKAAD